MNVMMHECIEVARRDSATMDDSSELRCSSERKHHQTSCVIMYESTPTARERTRRRSYIRGRNQNPHARNSSQFKESERTRESLEWRAMASGNSTLKDK